MSEVKGYRFDEFELDAAKRRLLREGNVVALKPKAFDLLLVLIENNGKLLTKDDIFSLVWGDQFVEETNLTVNISAIRRALGETASEPRYITNVSGRGYYFSGAVEAQNGLVVESHSFSRITVEHEESETASMPLAAAKPSTGFAAALVTAGVLITIGAAAYGLFFRNRVNAAGPFQALSVTKVTTTGRVGRAAISPDGRMIAFIQNEPNGLRTLNLSQIDGTALIQLRAPTEDVMSSVTFDPSGKRIYYVVFESSAATSGPLYRIPVFGGVPEKVKDAVPSRVAISPDGREIAFMIAEAASKDTVLKIAKLDVAEERELVRLPPTEKEFASAPIWSPDGKLLAVGVKLRAMKPAATEIFTVDVSDGLMRQLTRQGWESVLSTVWAKDAKAIIVAAGSALRMPDQEREIWQVPISGAAPERLLSDSTSYTSLDISADGSTLAAIQGQVLSNVWVAPADDLAAAKQTTFDMIGKNSGGNSIDWTSDGHILYSGVANKVGSIWEMNNDGSGQREAIPGGKRASYVSLPDDGKYIVFSSTRSGVPEVWRADRDGSNLLQLTTGGGNEDPHISPNGSFVVYSSLMDGDTYLWRVPIEGGTPVQLTRSIAGWSRISPDSKLIACKYKVAEKFELAILSADGGEPLKTFDVPASSNFRLSVRWTPDGKSVTYRDWQNGIWKQNIDGGEPSRLAGLPKEKLFAYAWSRDGKWFAYSRGIEMSDVVVLRDLK